MTTKYELHGQPKKPADVNQATLASESLEPGVDILIRYTPDEVIEKRWLPYKSARVLKEKCYRRKVIHHNDGGRITFTAEDIRRETERRTVEPRR
ncbi:hypothetical protein G6W61_27960 [Streptomyces sp. KAI-26]|uniref:hypothetical protein n=1 Tax=Streptomyces sp. KAI-26 TaxID=1169747 RepID=UPI0015879B0D|nr:hypothetical protein [Streptomyces sp. KAI-26]NUV89999.1 hypothetical protein [Streptomyces sp. KAI-26]NUW24013.1 hypothetical protein [Streptomyces roseoviolaceus]